MKPGKGNYWDRKASRNNGFILTIRQKISDAIIGTRRLKFIVTQNYNKTIWLMVSKDVFGSGHHVTFLASSSVSADPPEENITTPAG